MRSKRSIERDSFSALKYLGKSHAPAHLVSNLVRRINVVSVAVPQADDVLAEANAELRSADLVSNVELLPDHGQKKFLPESSSQTLHMISIQTKNKFEDVNKRRDNSKKKPASRRTQCTFGPSCGT